MGFPRASLVGFGQFVLSLNVCLGNAISTTQIDHCLVVKSQASADNAQPMNLGVSLITTVTSVSPARMVYGAYQNVGHQWILNRVLQKF